MNKKTETQEATAKIYGRVIGGALNVRKEANKDSEIIKEFEDGERILIKDPGESWHKVTGGYVMSKYVELEK